MKMKIQAINVTTFGNKTQVVKRAATGIATAAAAGLGVDTFVKGLSKPDNAIEGDIIKGNDEGWNPCDSLCDDICDTPEDQREKSNCNCD